MYWEKGFYVNKIIVIFSVMLAVLVIAGCASVMPALSTATSVASTVSSVVDTAADVAEALGVDADTVAAMGAVADAASAVGTATGAAASLGAAPSAGTALGASVAALEAASAVAQAADAVSGLGTAADDTATSAAGTAPYVASSGVTPQPLGTVAAATPAPGSEAIPLTVPTIQAVIATGSINLTSGIAGEIILDGMATGIRIREGGTITLNNVHTGNTDLAIRTDNGQIIGTSTVVMVRQDQIVAAVIEHPATVSVQATPTIVQPTPVPTPLPVAPEQRPIGSIGFGIMNLALGLGSYIQGDTPGGIIITGGYAAALGLLAWEFSLSYYDSMAGVPGTIGIGVAAATLVYGFVKPALFNRNHQLASAIDKVDITLASNGQNNKTLRISYTHSF